LVHVMSVFLDDSECVGVHIEHLPNNNRTLAGGGDYHRSGRNGGKSSKKTGKEGLAVLPHPQLSPSRTTCGHAAAAGMLARHRVGAGREISSMMVSPKWSAGRSAGWRSLASCGPRQRCCLSFRFSPRRRVPHGASWRVRCSGRVRQHR
jgi:hypothetical protein